jgi:Domain of unknown function (DUF4157)
MDSAPRTSDVAVQPNPFGRAISSRFRLRSGLARSGGMHHGPGELMRATRRFGLQLGLSQENRMTLLGSLQDAPVRPPIDYWPWDDVAAETPGFVIRSESSQGARRAAATTGPTRAPERPIDPRVAALRQLIKNRDSHTAAVEAAAAASAASATRGATAGSAATEPSARASSPPSTGAASMGAAKPRVIRRGLPLTHRRHGQTVAGPRTSPGGVAHNATPEPTAEVGRGRFEDDARTSIPGIASTGIHDSGAKGNADPGSTSSPRGGPRSQSEKVRDLRRLLQESGKLPGPVDEPHRPGASGARYQPGPQGGQASTQASTGLGSSPTSHPPVGAPWRSPVGILNRAAAAVAITRGWSSAQASIGLATSTTQQHAPAEPAQFDERTGLAASAAIMPPAGATMVSEDEAAETVPPGPGASRDRVSGVRAVDRTQESNGTGSVAPTPAVGLRPTLARFPLVLQQGDPAGETAMLARAAAVGSPFRRSRPATVRRSLDGRSVRWSPEPEPAMGSVVPGPPFISSREDDWSHAYGAMRAVIPTERFTSAHGEEEVVGSLPGIHAQPDVGALRPAPPAAALRPLSLVPHEPGDTTWVPARPGGLFSPASTKSVLQRRGRKQVTATGLVDPRSVPTTSSIQRASIVASPSVQAEHTVVEGHRDPIVPGWHRANGPEAPTPSGVGPGQPALGLSDARSSTIAGPSTRLSSPGAVAPRAVAPPAVALSPGTVAPPAVAPPAVALSPGAVAPPAVAPPAVALSPGTVAPPAVAPPAVALSPGTVAPPAVAPPAVALSPGAVAPPAVAPPAGTVAPPPGSVAPPPVDLADRFLTELTKYRVEQPRPLPVQFQPIAEVIVPRRRPLISTSEGSRRALAAVDKIAATTGEVIHLAEPAPAGATSAATTAVIAHELMHVAHPSPAPRFFDDDRHSPEEHRAYELGELMRRTPVLTNMAAGGASILARDTSSVIRREPSGYVSPPDYDLTNDPGGRASSSVSPPPSSSTSSSSSSTSSSMSSSPGSTTQSGHTMETSPTPSSGTEQDQFANKLRENFDVILEMLEETIVREIDRRGGRYRGDF